MKQLVPLFVLLAVLTCPAAENLLKVDFSRLDAKGKNAGFRVFRAQTQEMDGKKNFILDKKKNHFVTLPVSVDKPGIYTLNGVCQGDVDSVYAKLTVGSKFVGQSFRLRYMKKTPSGDLQFALRLTGVPAGEGVLFLSPRGDAGKLIVKELCLTREEPQALKLAVRHHPMPEIIDSGSERIEKSAALDIAANWKIRNPEDKRLRLAEKAEPGTLDVVFDTHTGKLETKHFPYVFRTGRLTCRLDRLIDLPQEVWAEFNQISVMVKPLCAHNRSHLWFDVLGVPGLQAAVNMKGNVWSKISISWNSLTPEKARKIIGISFGFGGFGTPAGEERYTRFLFKDFKIEKVVAGTENSWEVSPEKIVIPQTGFAPGEDKQALFSSSHKAEDFAVISNGKKVLTGKLVTEKFPIGTFKTARFSQLTRPGIYQIVSGNLRSVPFAIGYDHLKEAASRSRYFMNCMRLGGTTPLFPRHAQLADDARRSDTGEQVNVSGGWCDASDLCSFHAMAAANIISPLAWSYYRFNLPEMQSETWWGGKLLNKLFEPETGLPYTVMSHFGVYRAVNNIDRKNPDEKTASIIKNNGEWTMNKYFTDGIPNTGDERAIHFAKADGVVGPHDRQDFHYGITSAGHWMFLASGKASEFNKAFANSRRHFARLEKLSSKELQEDGIIPFERSFTRSQIFRLENYLALFLATGRAEYRKQASALLAQLLKKQERFWYATDRGRISGWFNSYRPGGTSFDGPLQAANVLSLYAEKCASKEEYLQILAALRLYVDGYAANPETRTRPYNMIYPQMNLRPVPNWNGREIASRGKVRLYANFRKIFLSEATGRLALDLMCAGTLLRDTRCQYAASEVLRYNLGENQSARSLMLEVGSNYNRQLMSTNFGWIPGMMGNPEISGGVAQLPYNRNCSRYEVYTQAQGAYTAALTMLSANALLCFDGVGEIALTDTITGIVYKSANGRFAVPGGTVYRVDTAGYPAFDLPVISGEKKTITLVPGEVFIKKLSAGPGIVELTLCNPSSEERTVRINIHAENARIENAPSVTLAPCETKTFIWKSSIPRKELAAVIALFIDDDFRNARSVLIK